MNLFTVLGSLADLIGILGALFALLAWLQSRQLRQEMQRETQRQNRKVMVIIRNGAQRLELPIELRRAELTRAEVLGRIGMIPMRNKGQRFSLNYLSTPEFLQQINQIAEGTGNAVLEIPCREDEFAQFDLAD